MRLSAFYLAVLVYIVSIYQINCWDDFEPDLFDLVEEVGQNFYEVFGIDQTADTNEIRKTYRKLSLKFHPDRNSEANAAEMFRRIVGIYEVLKDEEKRKRYNEILEFGLPDWREPIYYYRRYRKLSLVELLLAISIVVIIGHYFVMWAQYFENRLCLDERISETRKKLEKKQKKKNRNVNMEEIDKALNEAYDHLPPPSFKKTLPIRLVVWLYANKLFVPAVFMLIKRRFQKRPDLKDSDNEGSDDTSEDEREAEKERQRRRIVNDLNPKKIEKSTLRAPVVEYDKSKMSPNGTDDDDERSAKKKSIDNWTDAEKALLIKAISRYPGGTPDRWSTIAKYVERPAQQCIQMEKLLRTNYKASATQIQNRNLLPTPTSNDTVGISDDIMTQRDEEYEAGEPVKKPTEWNQEEQRQLEVALKTIGKDLADRWERIAEMVPGKTKDECIQRFKTLCQAINKNKK